MILNVSNFGRETEAEAKPKLKPFSKNKKHFLIKTNIALINNSNVQMLFHSISISFLF